MPEFLIILLQLKYVLKSHVTQQGCAKFQRTKPLRDSGHKILSHVTGTHNYANGIIQMNQLLNMYNIAHNNNKH